MLNTRPAEATNTFVVWITIIISAFLMVYTMYVPLNFVWVSIGQISLWVVSVHVLVKGVYSFWLALRFFLQTAIPAYILFFLVHTRFWQFFLLGTILVLTWHHLHFLNTQAKVFLKLKTHNYRTTIFPLINIFVVSACIFGLGIFFQSSVFINTVLFAILVVVYPTMLRMKLPLGNNLNQMTFFAPVSRIVPLWFDVSGGWCRISSMRFNTLRFLLQKSFPVVKTIAVVISTQMLLVLQFLPIDFFVKAAILSVATFGVVSSVLVLETGFEYPIMIRRALITSGILILLLLVTAQW